MSELVLGGFMICRPEPIPFDFGNDSLKGFTLMSDLHIGAPHVDYNKIEEEIQIAKDNGDRVLINGDLLDLILCKDMKRNMPDAIHPRLYGKRDILNEAVKWAVEVLKPIANQLDMVGFGNHEAAVEKYHNYDPISAVIYELQRDIKIDHQINYGGYTGFVDYRFRVNNKEKKAYRYVIYYHHGAGGSAPVTKGLIDFNRRDTFIDADILWLGHKHNRLQVHVEKLCCSKEGDNPIIKDVRHIMTGAYFKTYMGQSQQSIRDNGRRSNYAADSGMAPQGRGGARVELKFYRTRKDDGFVTKVIQ